MHHFRIMLWLCCALCLWAGTAQAPAEVLDPTIFGLFNTGVYTKNSPLTDLYVFGNPWSTPADPHYALTAVPPNYTGGSTEPYKVFDHELPSAWVPNSSASTWINANMGANTESNDIVPYTYRTTFSLSGLDASQVNLQGRFAADDSVSDVRLNGVSTGIHGGGFGAFTDFAISSGFQTGTNTLEFDVVNNQAAGPQNPSGLRVEFTGIDVTPLAAPSGIRIIKGLRRVTTTVDIAGGMGNSAHDEHIDVAPGLDPFLSTQTTTMGGGAAYGQGTAEQDSQVLGTSLTATGSASSTGYGQEDPNPWDYWPESYVSLVTASSQYQVIFLADAEMYFRIHGSLDGTEGGDHHVTLTGPGGTVFSATDAGPFDAVVTLQPGQYTLDVVANASRVYETDQLQSRSASFTFAMDPVPEPATVALLAAGMAWQGVRRRASVRWGG